MNFSVIIPYAWSDPYREKAFDYVRGWWEHMGYPTYVGLGNGGLVWSKGAAVHSVRHLVDTDGLIIADCDVMVTRELLGIAKSAVASGAAWAMPHGRVIRMNRMDTHRLYRIGEQALLDARQTSRHAPPGGGLVILTTAAYDTVGGIDPAFHGWGGEDISFARALDTLVGVGLRLGGYLWHLWHPLTPRRPGNRANPESEALAGRYLEAEGDPEAMRALVDRRTVS